MKTKKLVLALALAAGLTSFAGNAKAQTERLTFSGTLTNITSTSPFWNGISNGTSFTMTGYYDLTPNTTYSYTGGAQYLWTNQNYDLSASFGAYVFSMNNPSIEMQNNSSGRFSGFTLGNGSYFSSGGLDVNSGNGLQAGIISDALYGISPVVSAASLTSITNNYSITNPPYGLYARFSLSGTFNSGADSASVQGAVTSYSVQSVPEPSTYVLFGIGALVLVVIYRRNRTT